MFDLNKLHSINIFPTAELFINNLEITQVSRDYWKKFDSLLLQFNLSIY